MTTSKPIVAWDGEGITLEDGTHVYNLLANSEGEMLCDPDGLGTEECLEFLTTNSHKEAINVIFGGSYDIEMIIGDLTREEVSKLHYEGQLQWGRYVIEYQDRKKLTVTNPYNLHSRKNPLILWDVLHFFNTSFVEVARKWIPKGDPLYSKIDEMEEMKKKRHLFQNADLETVKAYNHDECIMLVKVMEHLLEAVDKLDIKLARYDGVGALAGALLRKNKVQNYKGSCSLQIMTMAQRAYAGGRIEMGQVGNAEEQRIWQFDVNSAYPANMVDLPGFDDSPWVADKALWHKVFIEPTDVPVFDQTRPSLVEVKWAFNDYPYLYKESNVRAKRPDIPPLRYYPFFVRDAWGSISYPAIGWGVYWNYEVEEAIQGLQLGETIIIEKVMKPSVILDHKPFGFVEGIYKQRQGYKRHGDMASEALKLGMNAMYGKLAQQLGYRVHEDTGEPSYPPYHQILWAGIITSKTRALLYSKAKSIQDKVISFNTDALYTTDLTEEEHSMFQVGDGLGEWSRTSLDGLTAVQPGVYFGRSGDEWHERSRGFDKGSLDREAIVQCWRDGKTEYEAKLTRFVRSGAALQSTDFGRWRKWITEPRMLSIDGTNSKRGQMPFKSERDYANKLCKTLVMASPTAKVFEGMLVKQKSGKYEWEGGDGFCSVPYPIVWLGQKPLKSAVEENATRRELEDIETL